MGGNRLKKCLLPPICLGSLTSAMPVSGKGGVLLADSRLSGAWGTVVLCAELLSISCVPGAANSWPQQFFEVVGLPLVPQLVLLGKKSIILLSK